MERICEVKECLNNISHRHKGAKYCEVEHRRICSICNREFVVNIYKIRETCSHACGYQLKTGYRNPSQNPEVKKAKNATLANNFGNGNLKQALQERAHRQFEAYYVKTGYHNPSQNPEVKHKKEATTLEHYGVTNQFLLPEVYKAGIKAASMPETRRKARETTREKYGVDNIFQSEVAKEKGRQTNLRIFGYTHPMKNPDHKARVRSTNLAKYGVSTNLLLLDSRKYSSTSKLNKKWHALLTKEMGIEFSFEVPFGEGKFSADLGADSLLIDINPTVSHNSDVSFSCFVGLCRKEDHSQCKLIANDYHYKRALAAESEGKTLIQVFDWMGKDIVLDMIRSRVRKQSRVIYARRTQVKEISQKEANSFLHRYHMQGGARGQTLCIGLFLEGELVQVQTFGSPRFNGKYGWEAIRLASKFDIVVVGGVSKGFAHFVKQCNPQSVISYVDYNRSAGATDEKTGFTFSHYTGPSCTWVNQMHPTGPAFVSDSALRKLGIHRLLRSEVDLEGNLFPAYGGSWETSNGALMAAEGYLRVWDAGSKVYQWHAALKP